MKDQNLEAPQFEAVPPRPQAGTGGLERRAFRKKSDLERARETLFDAITMLEDTRTTGDTLDHLTRVITLLLQVDGRIDRVMHRK